jgi:DNA-binding MarR family transcriptional regulator
MGESNVHLVRENEFAKKRRKMIVVTEKGEKMVDRCEKGE